MGSNPTPRTKIAVEWESHYWKPLFHLSLSELDDAMDEAKKALDLSKTPENKLQHACILARAGKMHESQKILDEVATVASEQYVSPCMIGMVELTMGHKDAGFTWLEKGLARRDPSILAFGSLPQFEECWSDPRWIAIDKRIPLTTISPSPPPQQNLSLP